ncbi:immunoglobulin-like domain-containing protein, partial [Bradyrhizobium elkanii]|uniref:immunoglobulin-like domain-containing protein n=1 Tax=Bradyrhizobium elkanii TaxID=29448 RepID=UPI0020112F89
LVIASGNGEDVYNDASQLIATITGTEGGNFEHLVVGTGSATAHVDDTITDATVNLSASTVLEGAVANYTFTATLSNASEGVTTVHTDQGDISIADGQTTGTLVIASGNGEDVYNDASQLIATITGTEGGNFENLVVGTGAATAHVNDTVTDAAVNLSTSNVTDHDPTITFTATLSNASEGITTVHTDQGDITIANGQTTGTLVVSTPNSSSLTATITGTEGGNFEHLVVGTGTATAQIIDTTPPTVAVDIVATSLSDGTPSSNVTFTFSEAPGASFTAADIATTNGTISGLTQDDSTHYHATFTATDGVSAAGSVSVTAGSYTDAAGNLGGAGSDTVSIDRQEPTFTSWSYVTSGGSNKRIVVTGIDDPNATFRIFDNTQNRDLTWQSITKNGTTWTFNSIDNGATIQNDSITVTITDAVGNSSSQTHKAPAGVAGEPINLGLADPTGNHGEVSLTIAGVPTDWTISGGTHNSDGSWTVVTDDIGSLTVTTPSSYAGALVLNVTETWINADGSTGRATVLDNVEAYAPGNPIFAISGDDNLTASGGNDLLVFSQPIGHDVVYSFDLMYDKIDLIGYAEFTAFADIQAHTANNAAGNAVITLGDGQTITLDGIDAGSLSADDFVFDQTPAVENSVTMTIGDGAILPLSGIIHNTGTISLGSTGSETDLRLIEHGISLEGGGQMLLSDNIGNVVSGAVSDVTLTNVDNTISGAGQLGAGTMTLINQSTIVATGANALEIDTGENAVINSGTLEATGPGGLVIDSAVTNSGLLWANGGNIIANHDVSGGAAQISGTATLELRSMASTDVKFDFDAIGTLKLDHSVNFTGSIVGLNADDQLDLADILSGAGTTASYAANAAGDGGMLSISDGTHTAHIALLGQYSTGAFEVGADGAGGTLIKYLDPHVLL